MKAKKKTMAIFYGLHQAIKKEIHCKGPYTYIIDKRQYRNIMDDPHVPKKIDKNSDVGICI